MAMSAASSSRFAILSWVNDTLLLPLTKIQQLGAGNVYCQLLDAAYPQRVPLHKVKWDAKLQIDFLHNFKVLTTSFQFLGIEKKIDIEKLSKARYQDNLQFVQWLKRFIQDRISYSTYQPLKRRNFAKIYLGFANKTKFNVTMSSSSNKQNVTNLDDCMKSSIKSNATMKSSTIASSRSSVSLLSASNCHTKTKTALQKEDQNAKRPIERRKGVGPVSFLTLKQGKVNKNQPKLQTLEQSKRTVKNVEVIESEGSEDEFF